MFSHWRRRAIPLLALTLVLPACGGPFRVLPRTSPLVPDGSPSVALMDFTRPIRLDPIEQGWYHRTFRGVEPMDISFVAKDGRPAIRLATHGTASMLFRFVDVSLDVYPHLRWNWLIEQAIETEADERTRDGDDHPARFYLKFIDANDDDRTMEVIWGNEYLEKGDWLHLSFFRLFSFPHYVANGGEENVGRWHRERVDLSALYRELWGDPAGARLVELALFCDTDQTGASSIAYFSDVRAERNEASTP